MSDLADIYLPNSFYIDGGGNDGGSSLDSQLLCRLQVATGQIVTIDEEKATIGADVNGSLVVNGSLRIL